jgi:hypothetical protein
MNAKAAVLVRHTRDDPVDWRRFAAILCMIEVYWRILGNGHYLHTLLQGQSLSEQGWRYVAIASINLIWAIAVFGLCRSLWRHSPAIRGWLIAPVVAGSALVLTKAVDFTLLFLHLRAPGGYTLLQTTDLTRGILINTVVDFLWIGVFLAIWRVGRQKPAQRRPRWPFLAAVWCLGWFLVRALHLWTGGDPSEDGLTGDEMAFAYTSVPYFARVVISGVPLLAGIALVVGWRISRPLCLVMAAAEVAPLVFNAYGVTHLVSSAMEALMISSPYSPTNPLPWPWILFNQTMFLVTCGRAVSLAGPWMLIAIYVRRSRMLAFPEDGSPWPRRYCALCHYNLHGIEPARCPECGIELSWDPACPKRRCQDELPRKSS